MPSSENKIIIASAGSRKTTFLVEESLRQASKRILVTTYTNENVAQISSYFVRKAGLVPANVVVASWYSFLLHNGVRPYQNHLTERSRIKTVDFISQPPKFAKKADVEEYFFTKSDNIYRDRVADFVCECDRQSGGLVVDRLSKVFDCIYVDELQDFAGYDLEVMERLFKSALLVTAVGDPRQATFSTNRSSKNKRYKKTNIIDWIKSREAQGLFSIDERCQCYRSNQTICDFADALYPSLPRTTSLNHETTGHDGVFQIKRTDVHDYVRAYKPLVLRYDIRADTMDLVAHNIGLMKGRTFDRVLIFPTGPMMEYLRSGDLETAGDVSKLYVAVTRAKYSATFVV